MRSSKVSILEVSSTAEKPCRNLFGPVDHEQLKIDFESMMKNLNDEAAQKWNFDFVNERPLDGNYKWERVDVLNTGLQTETNTLPDCIMESDTENSEPDMTVECGSKRKQQALMTDFYSVKRRGSPTPRDSCP
ncbi:cyclin-dependent kinase inhibitor 1 [Discoglossus pictus]